jgi:hypothetical protein
MSDHSAPDPAPAAHAGKHAADGTIGPHGIDDHGDGHDHDDHGHAAESLGPVDVAAWAAGAAGIVLGLVVAGCFALSTGLIGA